jgi:tripartite-type tricarboxylate transporter receptor subunit TctC
MSMLKRALAAFAAVLFAALPAAEARAQDYAARPLRLIVPYLPGGSTDIVARVLAEQLRHTLPGHVVVENRAGAGTNIGTEAVVRAAPDGHTILFGTIANSIAGALFPNLPFDPWQDLTPITQVSSTSLVMAVSPDLPVTDVRSFIALARARPGQLNAGTPIGSSNHLATELFKRTTDVQIEVVSYRGGNTTLIDLAQNRIQVLFENPQSIVPQAQAGQARLLAVTGRERSRNLPDLPTMHEAGVAGFEMYAWFGLFGPARMPPDTVAKLAKATREALSTPAMTARFATLGIEAAPNGPEAFARFYRAEIDKWSRIVREAGIVAN